MSTMVPMYGFCGGGGTGAAMTVTAPAGATVTVSKDGKTKTKVAGADGVAVFKGLATGDWTINMTDGVQTAAPQTVTITADYTTAITFFAATIHITYPAGSTCTATDGVTTLTAPDTSGTWDCVVPNAGTWTVSLDSGFCESVEITQNGEEKTIDKWYLYRRGDEYAAFTGGWMAVAKKYITESGYDRSTTLAPTVTKGETYMTAVEKKSGTHGNFGALETTNTIDLTNIDTLYFDIEGSGQYTVIYIGAVAEHEYKARVTFFENMTENETITRSAYAVDVSGLSGVYTIAISLYNGATDVPITLKIYNVYAG